MDIMHVDMNAFFAAVEQQENPQFRGKPVIVCGDPEGRSVVSTASYEARAFGVKSAMPVAQAKRLCPQGIFIKGDIQKYARMSIKILEIYKSFTPIVEPFSIDEAFLDVTGCDKLFGPPVEIAKQIKSRIKSEFGLTCSIGIGPNKLLAKMASDFQKPDGLVVIRMEEVPEKIWPLPVRALFGVGEKTERALHYMGIKTIGDLARFPVELLKHRFGVFGYALHAMAWGRDDSPVKSEGSPMKSMSNEYTLPEDTADSEVVRVHVLRLSGEVARRLRKSGYVGRTVGIKLRYEDFSTITRAQTLSEFTDSEKIINESAWELVTRHWQKWRKVRLIGVGVSNLAERKYIPRQLSLFEDYAKQAARDRALDLIRDRFGGTAVVKASTLFVHKNSEGERSQEDLELPPDGRGQRKSE